MKVESGDRLIYIVHTDVHCAGRPVMAIKMACRDVYPLHIQVEVGWYNVGEMDVRDPKAMADRRASAGCLSGCLAGTFTGIVIVVVIALLFTGVL